MARKTPTLLAETSTFASSVNSPLLSESLIAAQRHLDGCSIRSPSSPHAARHASQASGNGAVICVRTGDAGRSRRVVESLSLFPIRVSFGGVQSSASLPCCMSHASIPPEVRASRHFPEDLIRLSIGIEDPGDLLKDLTAALDAHPRGEGHASTAESSLHAQPAITSASPCS